MDPILIWNEGLPADHPNAEPLRVYLTNRGLTIENVPNVLRMHQSLTYYNDERKAVGRFPCVLLQVSDDEGNHVATHRIYITPEGKKAPVENPKKLTGFSERAAIRFDSADENLSISEGPETGLAIREALGLPTWCAISAGNMKNISVPSSVKFLHIWSDRDNAGIWAGVQLALRNFGLRAVFLHIPTNEINKEQKAVDYLDVLKEFGKTMINKDFQEAKEFEPGDSLQFIDKNSHFSRIEECIKGIVSATKVGNLDKTAQAFLRSQMLRRLKEVGIPEAKDIVKAAFSELHQTEELSRGGMILFSEPEPYQEFVTGAPLLDELRLFYQKYVAASDIYLDIQALWTLHTYVFDFFETSPYLLITSPEMRCGKSRLIDLHLAVDYRSLSTANITAAALFRTIEKFRPTLLIDEADTFLKQNEEIRGVINAGHQKGGAHVIRTVGEENDPRRFSVWCPKVIAMIGKPPATIEDRAITIKMRRKTKDEKVARFRRKLVEEEAEILRRKIARWASDNLASLNPDPEIHEDLNDREVDIWIPLLSIADACSGTWPERARRAALTSEGSLKKDTDAPDSIGILLLADVRGIFRSSNQDSLSSNDLVQKLQELEERPWRDWGKHGKGITPNTLAGLLRNYEIASKDIRFGIKVLKGYDQIDFKDAWRRYLDPQQGQQTATEADFNHFYQGQRGNNVAPAKNSEEPPQSSIVADVADRNPCSAHKLKTCFGCCGTLFYGPTEVCAACNPPLNGISVSAICEMCGCILATENINNPPVTGLFD